MPWSRPDRDAAQRHGASWAIGLSDRCGAAKEKRNLTSTCHGWLIWQGRYPRCPFRYAPTIMGLNGLALSPFAMVDKRITPSAIKRSSIRISPCVSFALDCQWRVPTIALSHHTNETMFDCEKKSHTWMRMRGSWHGSEATPGSEPGNGLVASLPFKAKQKEWALPLSNGLPMGLVSQLQ